MTRGQRGAFRTVLANRDARSVVLAGFLVALAEWAVWVTVLVHAYEANGTAAAGFVGLGLLVPGIVGAPLAGTVLDRRRPDRVLLLLCAAIAVSLAAAGASASGGRALPAVAVPAAIALMSVSVVRPCVSVIVSDSVRSVTELTAANLLIAQSTSVGALFGPLAASALIGWGGTGTVFWVAALVAVGAVAVALPGALSCGSAAGVGRSARRPPAVRALVGAAVLLTRRRGATALLVVASGQYLVVGALDLIYVVLATEEFGMGATGPGILQSLFGVGGVLGGMAATLLMARQQFAPTALVSLAAIGAAMASLAVAPRLAVAFVVFPVVGLSRSALDVSTRILIQRIAPQNALASVLATVEALGLVATLVGCLIAQVVIAISGARAAVAVVGVLAVVLLMVTAGGVLATDAAADTPVPTIRLLRRIPMFAMLPIPEIESVARTARTMNVPAGRVVVREGEPGDSYFAIIDGTVEVSIGGRAVRTMSRGQGFGEIALVTDGQRTATVTTATDVELLEIDRVTFLGTVMGHLGAQQAAWHVARSWLPELDGVRADAVRFEGEPT